MTTKATHDFDAETGEYTGKPPTGHDLKPEAKPTGTHDFDASTGRYDEAKPKAKDTQKGTA